MRPWQIVAGAILFGVGLGAGLAISGREGPQAGRALAAPAPGTAGPSTPAGPLPGELTEQEQRDIEVFRRAAPSVVSIRSVALRYSLFTLDVTAIPRGQGTGFIWDRQGHIVTNYHVIEGGDAFLVTLADRSEWEARVVGRAPHKDLAVLRIDAPLETLQPLPIGRSSGLAVGQRVLAVGNPFGLDHTLTVGVLSAVGRELDSPAGRVIRDVLQTDAAINPGNSGGPLLDSRGRLIGVNTAIVSHTGTSAGIGFAIPVDTVVRLVPQLIEHGKPIQPGIGITPVPPAWLPPGFEGVAVLSVEAGSPAERAGLRGLRFERSRRRNLLGDVIRAVDGTPVRDVSELLDIFEERGVGASVTLTVERDGELRDVRVRLEALE